MKTAANFECEAILMLELSYTFWISDGTGITGEEVAEKESVYSNMLILQAMTEILCY